MGNKGKQGVTGITRSNRRNKGKQGVTGRNKG